MSQDNHIEDLHREDLDGFRTFLRGLLMHGAIGTAIGGVCTLVGEPENIVIGSAAEWDFVTFATMVGPATIPTLIAGVFTCFVLEKLGWFGYGAELPAAVRKILADEDAKLKAESHQGRHLGNLLSACSSDLNGCCPISSPCRDRTYWPSCNHPRLID